MEDTLLMDAVERFIKGEMSKEEEIYFSDLRKKNPELDQTVVEQIFFLNELEKFADSKLFRQELADAENNLTREGLVSRSAYSHKSKVVFLWQRYRKMVAVAASIAGIVSLVIFSLLSIISPNKQTNIKPLVDKLHQQENKTLQIERKVNQLEAEKAETKPRLHVAAKFRATGFMIDASRNYLVTNAHVVQEARNQLVVENINGEQFEAHAVYVNPATDMAILQITDENFEKLPSYPYSIKRSQPELGDQVYMLGYPKQEIVYGEGYVSARNGYQMDSTYFQLNTAANEGTSGSPVINRQGELVGIISSMETGAEGVVYAIKPDYLFSAIDELKKMEGHEKIKITAAPSLRGVDRVSAIKKVDNYVFMIKGN